LVIGRFADRDFWLGMLPFFRGEPLNAIHGYAISVSDGTKCSFTHEKDVLALRVMMKIRVTFATVSA
jgi:hypothetical protein